MIDKVSTFETALGLAMSPSALRAARLEQLTAPTTQRERLIEARHRRLELLRRA